MNKLVEIATVALTIPALVLCLMVLAHWLPEATRAVRERRDAADWLVLGVAVSFAGITINLVWWTVYWWARIAEYANQDWLLDNGSWINLVSRQGAVIIAAYCHLKAYHLFSKGRSRDPSIHLWWSLGASALMALAMFINIGGPM